MLTVPSSCGRLKTLHSYSTRPVNLASHIRTWQTREFCRFFRRISVHRKVFRQNPTGMHGDRAAGRKPGEIHSASSFWITSVSARPARVHSWNAGSAIIASM